MYLQLGQAADFSHFDTSYKGWKRLYWRLPPNRRQNFDTSYKGWKRKNSLSPSTPFPNFDTSYKGWKPTYRSYERQETIGFRYFL